MTVHIAEDAAAGDVVGAVVLEVEGMTCGSCATRIERRLGKLPGVEASVNYATGRARVHGGEVGELVATVEKLGFRVRTVDPPVPATVPAPRSGATSAPSASATAGSTATPATPATATPATATAGSTATSATPTPAPATPPAIGASDEPAAAPAAAPVAAPAGSEPEGDRELRELRHRALVCLALTVPVVAVAMNPDWQFRYWQWFSLMLTAPVVVWGGWRFHRAALRNLRHATATMDTLVSLGTLAAFGWSVVTLFLGDAGLGGMRHGLSLVPFVDPYQGARTIYLETAAAVTTALLAGRWIELRGRRRGLATMRGLLDLRVPDAVLALGGREIRVPVDRVAVGDEVVVAAGEAVPVDGVVAGPTDGPGPAGGPGGAPAGHTAVDASAMTGESLPVDVVPGDEVLAGTRVVAGRLVLRAVRVGGETQWARMARRVEEAQTGKARAQRLADRVSSWFVPTVVVLALATLGFWWAAGSSAAFAFTAAVSVLIVACPCALGLATPAALMVGTGRGAQLGILLRGPEVLEQTRAVDTVVLDKTGTVTTGRMHLAAVTTGVGVHEDDLLGRAGALEDAVAHPIARAVAAGARERVGELAEAADVVVVDGLGAHGVVGGSRVLVGRPRLLADHGAAVPDDLVAAHAAAEAGGATAVLVAWADAADAETDDAAGGAADSAATHADADEATVVGLRARGVLAVTDTVREGAAEAVTRMRALGLRPVLLTGDNPTVAHAVAAEVGIAADDVVAGVLPVDKAAVVDRLREEGATVAMVGDGVNDAAALAGADLGVAMGTGADVAIEAGDVTLLRDDLRAVPDALRLARRTLAVIRTNLFWAFAYNVAALPLAALGLLNPMIAGVAMAASSIVVVSNSLRLRRFRPLTGAAG